MTPDAVVKLGGSLLASPELPDLLRCLGGLAGSRALVVVPGGGPFADAVREACARRDPGPSAAHWMATLAMDQSAHLLAGLLPEAGLVGVPAEVHEVTASKRLAVLAPFAWLRRADPLPHGWHVTSDSFAAWVAAELGAPRLVLLKSVEGLAAPDGSLAPESDARAAAEQGVVDDHFPSALAPGLECWILCGRHPERLAELLQDGRTRGTRIYR
jgi:5-(aminomethyl)-3-furanmethanol phosphate kinase